MSRRDREAGPKHLYIPDTQVKPDLPQDHIEWAGAYAGIKRPDVIVIGGDWYDMPSLSIYDAGKLASHGRRYADDVASGSDALKRFERALRKYGGRGYKPRKIVTLGNHEERILRAVESDPKMEGKVSLSDLAFREYGWTVYDFLQPVEIHGIVYAHYFPLGPNGRVAASKFGAPSAKAQVQRMMRSCTAGHRQGLDVAILHTPTATYRGVIAGSYYRHDEGYLTPMGTNYWRGLLMCHDIDPRTGNYNLMEVDMRYMERRFG